jgi:hypothetical protein
MGWKTFETEPTDGELIMVYIEDAEGTFWYSEAIWSADAKRLRYLGHHLFDGQRILLWRERVPEPPTHVKNRAKELPDVISD